MLLTIIVKATISGKNDFARTNAVLRVLEHRMVRHDVEERGHDARRDRREHPRDDDREHALGARERVEAALDALPFHTTQSELRDISVMPITPPTHECVVETGISSHDASSSHMPRRLRMRRSVQRELQRASEYVEYRPEVQRERRSTHIAAQRRTPSGACSPE